MRGHLLGAATSVQLSLIAFVWPDVCGCVGCVDVLHEQALQQQPASHCKI